MKILIGTDTYFPHSNGVSYFTQRLAKGLVERGHEVLVIAPSAKFSLTKTKINGVNVVGIRSLPYPFYDKGYRFTPPGFIRGSIDKVIEDFKPDAMAGVMGGMSKEEAQKILAQHGIKENQSSSKPIITEQQIRIAKKTLSNSNVPTGMSKKDAVQILVKHLIK